jgi:hypothetical protein
MIIIGSSNYHYVVMRARREPRRWPPKRSVAEREVLHTPVRPVEVLSVRLEYRRHLQTQTLLIIEAYEYTACREEKVLPVVSVLISGDI